MFWSPWCRTDDRQNYRNGYRQREWDTRIGTLLLQIPKLRQGSYFPSFLQRRRKSEEALAAVIQEARVHGVSTRKVDDLVQAMGLDGVDKSAVSRICARLDEEVRQFKERPISQRIRYMWLDATYVTVREHSSVVSMALVLAVGVREGGYREVLGWETLSLADDDCFGREPVNLGQLPPVGGQQKEHLVRFGTHAGHVTPEGTKDGATTRHLIPSRLSCRYRAYPHGPTS